METDVKLKLSESL